jgi:hypothetical protein
MTSLLALATILTVGCELTTEGGMNPTAPSAVGSLLMGTWVSATAQGGAGFPSASDCTELEWTITEENGSNYAGEFSATCNDGIQLDGTATGVLTGNVLDIEATGTATLPDVASCAFTLSGTAVLEDETISVNYSGDTCLGSVSGSELLQRS